MKNPSRNGSFYIILAGSCWGFIGLFVKNLYKLGLTPYETVFYRMLIGTAFLALVIMFKPSAGFKIGRNALSKTLAIGLISQMLFNYSYFKSIDMNPLSLAVILMYTSPVFAIILARILYKESLSPKKIVALICCLGGCFFTVTGGNLILSNLSLSGILFGLLSGLSYAMFPIISKSIPSGTSPYTLTFYSMLFGCIFFIPVAYFNNALTFSVSTGKILNLALLASVSTALPYIFYYTGMSKGIEASKAGVISSIEVAVAIIVSIVFFRESLNAVQFMGIILVCLSIFILSTKKRPVFPVLKEPK
ncbi:MAG: EamA family transporter [Peptostreptococcaceae bacterium]|nr:EamA family transporter [Peptostreptococcaceae bacterium]